MPGNYFFSIFSPEKLEKVTPPHPGGKEVPRYQGITLLALVFAMVISPDARESPFRQFLL